MLRIALAKIIFAGVCLPGTPDAVTLSKVKKCSMVKCPIQVNKTYNIKNKTENKMLMFDGLGELNTQSSSCI